MPHQRLMILKFEDQALLSFSSLNTVLCAGTGSASDAHQPTWPSTITRALQL
jgi:hypothetical protein